MRRVVRVAAVVALVAGAVVAQAPAAPADSHITTILNGSLQNPRGLAFDDSGNLYIGEAGVGGSSPCMPGAEGGESCYGETGGITKVTDLGGTPSASRIVDNLPSHALKDDPSTTDVDETGMQGLGGAPDIAIDGSTLYFTIGLGADPAVRSDVFGSTSRGADFATVWSAGLDGTGQTKIADLGTYEATENPDDGLPGMGAHDTNPFGIVADADALQVLDSGGNYQASIDLTTHDITTAAVFPPAFVPAPPFLMAPSGTRIPAQPVPTQLVADPDGGWFVGQLTGFPFYSGAASVWHTDGAMMPVTTGFTNIMDVAWHDGDLYVLEISHNGLLAGITGALIRVDPATGTRELLADDLLMPGGIAFGPDGAAYITLGSGMPTGSLIRFDVDAAPVLLTVTDDTATTTEDTPVSADVIDNDGANAVLTGVPDNSQGAAWMGSVEYQPKAHFTGVDHVTYQACDPAGTPSDPSDDHCMNGVLAVTVTASATDRIAGPDRAATAVTASRAMFPDGAPAVVIARQDAYPDALSGSVLAAQVGGPILLTPSTVLDDGVAAEINRLGATTAYVLGGTSAVSDAVKAAIESSTTATTTKRIGGATRFDTAAMVKDEVETLSGSAATAVYVAEGQDPDPSRGWPDALSASYLAAYQGRPILLVTTDALPGPTADALADVDTATIVGGSAAVSDAVATAIDGIAGIVTRIQGSTRYGTSKAVANAAIAAGMSSSTTWLASGQNYPDALVLGPLVAKDGGVMMLTAPDDLGNSPEVQTFLEDHSPFSDVDIAGGTAAVSAAVEAQIRAIITIAAG